MTWKAAVHARDASGALDPVARHVLVAIGLRANRAGDAWPSVATLSSDTGWGDSAVRRAIRRLAGAGLLQVIHRPGTALRLHLTPVPGNAPTAFPAAATAFPAARDRVPSVRGKRSEAYERGEAAVAPLGRAASQQQIVAAAPAAIEACEWCDEFGWLWTQDGTIEGRCSHRVRRKVTDLTVPEDFVQDVNR